MKYKTIFISLLVFTALLVAFGTEPAAAQIKNPVIGELGQPEDVASGSKFIGYAVYLWRTSISLGALAVILYFIWGAFEWLTAGSDSKKTETARHKITNAVIGLILMVSSFTLMSFISKVLFGDNFDLLRLTFPTMTQTAPATTTPATQRTNPGGIQTPQNPGGTIIIN